MKIYRGPSAPVPVLSGVDLRVEAGALAVVAGTSGSGKSTLLNVLGLLEDADGGAVWYGDVCVSALSRSEKSRYRGRSVGFVFQSFLLLPSLTALDNVLLAGKYVGAAKAESRRRAQALLEQFGVLARRAHYPRELSGGEQQRVAFCRAILNDPPLLLADEPTGNLDDDNAALILRALRDRAEAGGAVVVVTHRPDAVPGAHAVYALENGRLTAMNPRERKVR
ncbi:MAG TPA: ABC transporter ATP-binding protein [Candidatus Acidoferrum sp.]|nr:ABC transporter ATP-binding protein [Candidatus Acidoferrum sp.]